MNNCILKITCYNVLYFEKYDEVRKDFEGEVHLGFSVFV